LDELEPDNTGRRKLAAILSADVAGYSRLMGADERATLSTLKAYRAVFEKVAAKHHGKVVNAPGDSLLVEFASVIEAVACAAETQGELERRNEALPSDRRMQFRIGVNLGDVIAEPDGSLYGDGVNVAARLEALAEPGGICISGKVFDEVEGRLPLAFDFTGEHEVKNISKPVRVYRWRAEGEAPAAAPPRGWFRGQRWGYWIAGFLLVLAAASGVAWYTTHHPSSTDTALSLPTGPSLAVLPFANLSGDPAQDYFAEGVSDQIITSLARYRSLFVIARNSTFRYKREAADVRQVGKELGVRYVLEGSVQRGSEKVRVTVQLVDAASGGHLWADSYEAALSPEKVFEVQDEITQRVVGALAGAHGAISQATFDASKGKPSSNLDAYECVLRYYAYFRSITPSAHARVRECLERAVLAAPEYPDAWVSLADIYLDEYAHGFNERAGSLERALEAARRAVTLDPGNQMGRFVLARVHFFLHDFVLFPAEAERALALNPNNVDVLAAMGLHWTYANFADEKERGRGVAMLRKAMKLNPMYPTWYHFPIAWDLYEKGDYQAALQEAKRIDLEGYFWTHVVRAAVYGAMGRGVEGKRSVEKLMELYPDFASRYQDQAGRWNLPQALVDRISEDLRKAGLPVSEEAARSRN
jgi:adenylate cyclase